MKFIRRHRKWSVLVVTVVSFAVLSVALHGEFQDQANGPRNTVQSCEIGFIQQIAYSEAHPGSGASMNTNPASCNGLTQAQVKQAAGDAVLRIMP